MNGAYQIRRWQANVGEIGASFTMPLEDVGSWVYLAGTFDGIAWHLYRNGVEVASTPDTAGSGNADGGWAIAARAATPFDVADSFFMGNVDEVAIYNYALTPSQVTQHYTGVSAPTLSIAPAADKLRVEIELRAPPEPHPQEQGGRYRGGALRSGLDRGLTGTAAAGAAAPTSKLDQHPGDDPSLKLG